MAEGKGKAGGSGSLEEDREDETVDPGPESLLELRLVLLCGLSGWAAGGKATALNCPAGGGMKDALVVNGGITPNGRPVEDEGIDPADPERRFDLRTKAKITTKPFALMDG